MKKNTAALILAAGKSTRMKSETIKVLHRVSGKYIIDFVLETVEAVRAKTVPAKAGIQQNKISDVYLVIGHQGKILKELYKCKYNFVEQKDQLGTGHAVETALKKIKGNFENIIVLNGDMPLIEDKDIKDLIDYHVKNNCDATVLTVEAEGKTDFGRILRSASGKIEKIVEVKDANFQELEIKEVNSGVYCFKLKALKIALSKIGFENRQKEKYLTDTISYLVKNDFSVDAYVSENKNLAIGINTRVDLAKVASIINEKKLVEVMLGGVTVIDPANTYIHEDVKIGADTVINPFTIIEGETVIGKNCVIGPSTRINNCVIGNQVSAENAVLLESEIKDKVNIGPFAYIRPGSVIGSNVKIGDFVEIKKSSIGNGSKVPHLSYIGDSLVGEKVNIGAGVITCNYDGNEKHKTIIADNCFIGANSNLVAPLKIGKGSKTGAGSVVTKDIPENTLAVGIPARAIKKISR